MSDIADLVIDDIRDRKKVGMANYGHALKANNGRNALRDLYEELLDSAQYCKQRLVEDDGSDLARLTAENAELRKERDSALATVETLTEERDALQVDLDGARNYNAWAKGEAESDLSQMIIEYGKLESTVAEMKEELKGVRQRLGEAVGLLRPFAKVNDEIVTCVDDNVTARTAIQSSKHPDIETRVTVGDFRRASAFIAHHDAGIPK